MSEHLKIAQSTDFCQARRKPQRGLGKHYRGAGPYQYHPLYMSWDRDAEGIERELTWGGVSPHHPWEHRKLPQRGPGLRKWILCIF